MNRCAVPVVSCDIASGVDADTGVVLGDAVRADVTVTFSMAKPGQLVPPGLEMTGELIVADIGIPPEAQQSQPVLGELTDESAVRGLLPKRARNAHKGDFGKLLLVCGSRGLTGAAALAARAALRSGAGLVSLGVPASVYPILAAKLDEAMVFPLPDDADGKLCDAALPELLRRLESSTACLIGPGLGRSEQVGRVVTELVSRSRVPLVVDADGINALAQHMDVLRGASCPVVLTPHDGEFARLGGDLTAGRFAAARQLSAQTGAVVLLKGNRTVIAQGDRLAVNSTGNPGMATGGSGDVLSGVIVSLLGQGLPAFEAAQAGAWLHGAAGDRAAAELGQYGLLPSDLIGMLPRLLP
jgi:NAD(P)H-hydrate epimerase